MQPNLEKKQCLLWVSLSKSFTVVKPDLHVQNNNNGHAFIIIQIKTLKAYFVTRCVNDQRDIGQQLLLFCKTSFITG